jgi:predicted kinase
MGVFFLKYSSAMYNPAAVVASNIFYLDYNFWRPSRRKAMVKKAKDNVAS